MSDKESGKGALYRSYGFWVSVAAMLLIIIKAVLNGYGIKIEEKLLSDIADGVLAVLVVGGVVTVPKKVSDKELTEEELTQDVSESESVNPQDR